MFGFYFRQGQEDPYAAGRISLRVHPDLRSALDFLAAKDARPLSAFIELVLIIHARHWLANGINNSGERLDPKTAQAQRHAWHPEAVAGRSVKRVF